MNPAERHGAVLDEMATAIVQQKTVQGDDDMKAAVSAAVQAKNQLVRRAGFSPAQCVLGADLKLPGDVLDSPEKLAMHSLALEESVFKRALDMRQAAREAFAE